MGDICPGSRKKRSLPGHLGSLGSKMRNSEKSTLIKSAPPIAPPGCPLLARSTIEAARIRMLSAARVISCSLFMSCDVICSLSLLYIQIASGSHTYPRTLKDTTNLTPPAQPSPASLPTHLTHPTPIYIRYSGGEDPHCISSCLIRAPPSLSFSCQLAPPL